MRTTYLVCYDIADDKRLRRVFKTCRNFGNHLQYSIFECDLSGSEKVRLETALKDIIDIVFSARPSMLSMEGANPRHAHEWAIFEDIKLPEGKKLIPGVLESKTNFIEHPELVAQRLERYAQLVGPQNVMAGTDCGYGTWVGQAAVDPDIVFAKFSAMAEGAGIARAKFK